MKKSRERHILHITLGSGHTIKSPRSGVLDETIEILRPLLIRALKGDRVGVPRQPGFSMTGGVHGRCCMITVSAQVEETASPRPIPVLSIGVAGNSRCGAHLWRTMHERPDLSYATDPERVPPAPWCADRIDLGSVKVMDAMAWTGDLSRCLAWTWLELREGEGWRG